MSDDRADGRGPGFRGPSILPLTSQLRAAKTTIVGGQPPDSNNRAVRAVPVNLEELLGMAAVDARFAEALYADRLRAVDACGLELTDSERRVLAATPTSVLRQMVASVASTLADHDRRQFIRGAGAAMLVLVGGAAAGACGCKTRPASSGPPAQPAGISPDPPPTPVSRSPDLGAPSAPHPATLMAGLTSTPPDAGRPDARQRPAPPDRPQSRGIRPDRPRRRPRSTRHTRGIRPDLPGDRGGADPGALDPFKK